MDNPLIFWSLLIISALCLSFTIVIKQKLYKPFAIIALFISLFPITLVTIDCYSNSHSEACVWGKSFMPLYLGISLLFVTPIVFIVYYFGKKLWKKLK